MSLFVEVSRTRTLLFSSPVRKRRCPSTSGAKWSKSPSLSPGRGIVSTSFNGAPSPALALNPTKKENARVIALVSFISRLLQQILLISDFRIRPFSPDLGRRREQRCQCVPANLLQSRTLASELNRN